MMHLFLTDAASVDVAGLKNFFQSLTLEKILPTLAVFVAGVVIVKLMLRLFEKLLSRSKLERAAYGMIRATMKVLLYFILILVVASQLGIDVSSLIAVLSVISLAITLAVQGTLTNVVGGISLLTTHPFKAGDYVDIGAESGTVQEVGLAYTTLLTVDNKTVHIPNGVASSARIVNYSTAATRRVDLKVSASYDCATEDVKAALLQAANVPTALFTPAPFAAVDSYGDSAITYVLRTWTNTEDYWTTYFAINENIRAEFDKAGIAMTYPHLNVHLDKEISEAGSNQ